MDGRRQPEPRVEVVHHLGEQPCAVDRVDGPEAPAALERRVVEEGLHDPLAVVERPLDRDAMHVGFRHRRHLELLEAARTALREQDEHPHVRLALERRDRGAPGVPACRAEDVQGLAGAPEPVVEEVPEELEGEVLEGEGRPMEELEEVEIAEWHEGGDFRGVEPRPGTGPVRGTGVGPIDEGPKVRLRDVVGEAAQDLEGERRIGEPPPRLELPRHVGERLGHQQTAVGRLPGHEGGAERDRRPRPSGAHVAHGGKCIRCPERRPQTGSELRFLGRAENGVGVGARDRTKPDPYSAIAKSDADPIFRSPTPAPVPVAAAVRRSVAAAPRF